ncbi:MAG: anti-sigma factor antagonist [Pseudonocardiales bacterium]|nr:anti-sigma factor antagonist [Pseudonocardiales bacterium]MDT4944774.1 anti-sigma factor antagonist [Pseudonocardiales bacterium]
MELSVSQQSVGAYPVLAVRGEVDVYSAPALKNGLTELLGANGASVIVDLTDVGFLDSTGLGVLVAARTAAAEAGGRLPIVCDRERILKLFRITGLDGVFEIYPSRDDAVSGLADEAPSA